MNPPLISHPIDQVSAVLASSATKVCRNAESCPTDELQQAAMAACRKKRGERAMTKQRTSENLRETHTCWESHWTLRKNFILKGEWIRKQELHYHWVKKESLFRSQHQSINPNWIINQPYHLFLGHVFQKKKKNSLQPSTSILPRFTQNRSHPKNRKNPWVPVRTPRWGMRPSQDKVSCHLSCPEASWSRTTPSH